MQEFKRLPITTNATAHRKLIWGVGINDANYQTSPKVNGKTVTCPIYRLWSGMMQRAYSLKYQELHPTYKGVTVCDEWKLFSCFAEWYKLNYIKGFDLDKDLKVIGNKEYSPEACLFIPQDVNKLFTDRRLSRGLFPLGVSNKQNSVKYRARVNRFGKSVALGDYFTVEEAHYAYKVGKNESIRLVIEKYPEYRKYLTGRMYKL